MSLNKKIKIAEKLFYLLCALVVLFAGFRFFKSWWNRASRDQLPKIAITVTGNVKNPGRHRIPWGSTMFELLQVAGVKPTSDLNQFALAREVSDGEAINVDQLDAKVNALKSYKVGACELDYFKSPIEIATRDGSVRRPSMGIFVSEGDRISCSTGGEAVLKWKDKSLIAMRAGARIVTEKIAERVGKKRRNIILVEQGKVWAKIQPQGTQSEFQFRTPHLLAHIRGTEFVLDVTGTESQFKLFEGMAYVQNLLAREGINLISGQKVTSFGGSGPLRPEEIAESDGAEEFQMLLQERDTYYKKHKQINLLFCGIPSTYVFFRMNPARKEIVSLHIPVNTWVGNLVQGFQEFDKAFLYGGAKFTASIAEKLLQARVDKYVVYGVRDVQRTIDLAGGIDVDIDSKAASYLNMTAGVKRLNGYQATKFMSPVISGIEHATDRQKKILLSLFQGVKNKNILLSTAIITRSLANTDGNLTVKEAMEAYNIFNTVKGWKMQRATLPGKYFERDGDVFLRASPGKVSLFLNK